MQSSTAALGPVTGCQTAKATMPTLLIKEGFKFFFYANEHLPMHVHVTRGDAFCVIELTTLTLRERHMRPADAKRAQALVREHQAEFQRRWNEFFDPR